MQTASLYRRFGLGLLGILFALLAYYLLPIDEPARRVVVTMIIAIFFWAFEVLPLFATSLLVVVLLTLLLISPVNLLNLELSYFWIPFSSPVIMLFFGGLTLAAAGKRHGLDAFLMQKMVAKLGQRSSTLLLGLLFITAFFSMWISNTAATALMLMMIAPILHSLEKGDPLKKGLVLAIAFGANIGGITTPIGTPPNAIALGILRDFGINLDFLKWIMITTPLAIILLFLTAVILYWLYCRPIRTLTFSFGENSALGGRGILTLVIACFMILLWLTKPFHHIPESLVALIGVTLFCGLRLIGPEEIRSIPWDTLILMWGGLALGEAVQSSGLIHDILKIPLFLHKGTLLIVIFAVLAFILTSFISNTATANLLLPLAIALDPSNMLTIAIVIALACSFSFLFPISTPPNALAYSTRLISVGDMFKAGGILSLLSLIILLSCFQLVLSVFN